MTTNKVHFFAALNRIALSEAEASRYMPEFKAPKTWVDSAKIAAEIQRKREEWVRGLDSNPVTSLVDEICIKVVIESNDKALPDFKELDTVFKWKQGEVATLTDALAVFFESVYSSIDKNKETEVIWYGVEPSFYRDLLTTSFVRDETCVKNPTVALLLNLFLAKGRSFSLDSLLGVHDEYISKDKAYADHKNRWGQPRLNLNSPANMAEFVRWCFALHGIVPKT